MDLFTFSKCDLLELEKRQNRTTMYAIRVLDLYSTPNYGDLGVICYLISTKYNIMLRLLLRSRII